MRILLTNDDGMHASQLVPLIRACKKWGDVTAVVPKVEQSGMSHAIEIHKAFEVKQVSVAPDITVYAVDSTPADCVRFAILGLKKEFDLCISGINRGFNIGTDMVYSGTVGAACEACALGVKAVSVSTPPSYYDKAVMHLDKVFDYIFGHKLLELWDIYNVNIPPQAGDIRITHQGGPYYSDDYVHVEGNLYQAAGKCVYQDNGDLNLDTNAVMHGYISITPITIDKTNMAIYRALTQQGGCL
jgi:5'-nucleotidase